MASASAGAWLETSRNAHVSFQYGPVSSRPPASTALVHSYNRSSINLSDGRQLFNQCVFLRAYRISVRAVLPRVLKAAAEPMDPTKHNDTDNAPGVVAQDGRWTDTEAIDRVLDNACPFSLLVSVCSLSLTCLPRIVLCMILSTSSSSRCVRN